MAGAVTNEIIFDGTIQSSANSAPNSNSTGHQTISNSVANTTSIDDNDVTGQLNDHNEDNGNTNKHALENKNNPPTKRTRTCKPITKQQVASKTSQ